MIEDVNICNRDNIYNNNNDDEWVYIVGYNVKIFMSKI
jgi:hypothetical protein